MPELFVVTVADMIAEVAREIRMRRAVYPGQVEQKRLSQARADRQIEVMEAVQATLERLRDGR